MLSMVEKIVEKICVWVLFAVGSSTCVKSINKSENTVIYAVIWVPNCIYAIYSAEQIWLFCPTIRQSEYLAVRSRCSYLSSDDSSVLMRSYHLCSHKC